MEDDMDLNRFTEKAQEALGAAQSKAIRSSHQQVDVEHLLATLLEQEQGLAASILTRASVSLEALKRRVDQELDRLPKVSGPSGAPDQIYITGRLNRLLTQAEDEAKRLKDQFISVEHLLPFLLLREPSTSSLKVHPVGFVCLFLDNLQTRLHPKSLIF